MIWVSLNSWQGACGINATYQVEDGHAREVTDLLKRSGESIPNTPRLYTLARPRTEGEDRGNLRSMECEVSYVDSERITHSVTVSADSLFEACIHELAAFRKSGLTEPGRPSESP
jgi:hypothetical protein